MAQPITVPYSKFILTIGDGATPTEAFDKPCGLTTQGVNFTKETNDQVIPDCDDPDLAPATGREVASTSAAITGEGILAAEFFPDWWAFYTSSAARNVKVALDTPAPNGGEWLGKFHLTGFNVTANLGEKVGVAIEMQSDGPVAWTATP
jgi:hypothetical protein